LESLGKTFRHDQTNTENHFTRNRIRNDLLPLLREKFNPQVDEAVCRLAMLAAEQESILAELLDGLIETALLEQSPDRVVLDVLVLQHLSPPVIREILIRTWKRQHFPQREMNYEQWSALAELFQTSGKRLDLPGGISAERTQNRFVIVRNGE
jgi:tRNA(Ile)-lysidine synthase